MVALDSAQNLYRRQPGLPPPAQHRPDSTDTTEISGRGRTEVLRVNYRNTYEILKFADDFLRAGGVPEGGDEEDPATFIPPEAAERSGPAPDVRPFQSHLEGYQSVCAALRRSHAERVPWSDMAILAGNWDALNEIEQEARQLDIPTFKLVDLNPDGTETDDGVRLSTMQLAKGLEFARVYIIGVDDIRGGRAPMTPAPASALCRHDSRHRSAEDCGQRSWIDCGCFAGSTSCVSSQVWAEILSLDEVHPAFGQSVFEEDDRVPDPGSGWCT